MLTASLAALAAGAVAACCAARAQGAAPSLLTAAGVGTLAWIVAVDIRTRRAPNRVVYPAATLLTAGAALPGLHHGLLALAGGAAAFAILFLVALVGGGAMGFGDVKVGYLCGLIVGLPGLIPFFGSAFIAGGCFAALALALRLRKRKDSVAFTPFMFIGVLWALLVGGL